MLRLLWTARIHTRSFLRRYMPTNILLDLIRTRRGLKWGLPAMLLAALYLLAASICTNLIGNGGPAGSTCSSSCSSGTRSRSSSWGRSASSSCSASSSTKPASAGMCADSVRP